jgi:hypothetical protein
MGKQIDDENENDNENDYLYNSLIINYFFRNHKSTESIEMVLYTLRLTARYGRHMGQNLCHTPFLSTPHLFTSVLSVVHF